jgi:hypothetical protein
MTVGASGAAPCVLEIIGSGLRPKGGESDNDGDKDGRTQNCPRAHGQRLRETTKARRKRLGWKCRRSVGGNYWKTLLVTQHIAAAAPSSAKSRQVLASLPRGIEPIHEVYHPRSHRHLHSSLFCTHPTPTWTYENRSLNSRRRSSTD